MVRELWVKKANPYHWPKNKISKGIAQSTMASVALAYQATIAVNSVIIQNPKYRTIFYDSTILSF